MAYQQKNQEKCYDHFINYILEIGLENDERRDLLWFILRKYLKNSIHVHLKS